MVNKRYKNQMDNQKHSRDTGNIGHKTPDEEIQCKNTTQNTKRDSSKSKRPLCH